MKNSSQKLFLYLTLVATPLYLVRFSIFQIPTNLFEILIILNLSLWLFQILKQKNKFSSSFLPWQFIISVFLILSGLAISIFTNNSILTGLGILKSWFLLPLFFSYLVFITLKDEFETEKALFSLYCSTSLVAIISLGYELTGFVTFDGRLQGFYTSPNYLAMYLAPGAILGVYFFTKTLQQNIKLSKKTFFGLSLILTILVIFYTYSYATWLALFASLLLTTYFYFPKNQFYLVLTCSCVLCLGLLASQANTQKFSTIIHFSERSSLSSRFIIWQASIKMLIENPLVGIGPGNFQTKYLILQPYFPPYLEWAVPQPHNIFLAFWLQSGLIGLFGFLFLLGFLFLQFLLEIKNKKTPLASVFFAFFVYLILHGFVDTPFWKNDLAFVFWVFVFLSLNYTIILQKNDPTK